MDQLRRILKRDRSRAPSSLARPQMEGVQWRNQKTVRGLWFLDENVSFRPCFVGRLSGGETVAFFEALRILKVIAPEESEARKGVQGYRVEASRNFWEGSGLKIDSSSTDVVWGHGGESSGLCWVGSPNG